MTRSNPIPRRGMLLLGGAALLVAPRHLAAQPGAAAPAAAAGAAGPWPHTIAAQGATVVVYQPQVISWPGHTTLNARAALSITRAGEQQPLLGTVQVTADTRTDLETRTVILSNLRLVSSRFPGLDTGQAAQLEARLRSAIGALSSRRVPLDTLLLSLGDGPRPPDTPALNNDPPVIFHAERPASLVVFDGEPVLAPVANTGLSVAVNTNWDVFTETRTGSWYLLDDGGWLTAPAFTGPWRPADGLPGAFSSLPDDGSFTAARAAIPGRTFPADGAPRIFVSTRPAEIIVTDGPPNFAPVPGTALQRATNTQSALFRDTADSRFYILLSGRWFAAASLDGPWTFATPNLPADFARIPPESPVGSVLSSVPGTSEAEEAVLQAQIPRQATLSRSTTRLQVTYVGPPRFEPIPGTTLSYAVNTSYEVLKVGNRYYCCYQGAWFVAPAPAGPWTLADSVPQQIRQIPPSHPLHNVTYVQVYGATPAAVTFGYTAGYLAGYVSGGVLVYGTGYYYPPVVVPGPVPAYLPYPYTYAGGVYYNPANGAWARGGAVYGPYGAARAGVAYNPATGAYAAGGAIYGPYGGAGAWSAYNPATGGYARGSAVWGPDGGTAHGSWYNPRTGISGSTTQNANPYARWGSSEISGPNQTVHTESGSNARGSAGAFSSTTGAEGAGVRGAGGNSAGVVRGAGGNVYAGADGNVYRHTDDGWSKWSNGSWQPVTPPQRGNNQPQSGGAGSAQQGAQRGRGNQPQAGTPGGAQQGARPGGSEGVQRTQFRGEQGNWDQLQRDRAGRSFGEERQRMFGGGIGAGEGGFQRPFSGGFSRGEGFGGFRRR